MKKNYSDVFDETYQSTLEEINSIIDIERDLEQKTDWNESFKYLSEQSKKGKNFLKGYKKVLENDLKIKEMQRQLEETETPTELPSTSNSDLYLSKKKRKKIFLTHLEKSKNESLFHSNTSEYYVESLNNEKSQAFF